MKDLRANDSLPQNENGLIRTRLEKGFMALLVAFMLFLPISQSKAGAVIGATEITQILNNVELIGIFGQEALHLAETIKQYQIMLQNLQKLPSIIETNATNALLSLANSTQVGMALTYWLHSGRK